MSCLSLSLQVCYLVWLDFEGYKYFEELEFAGNFPELLLIVIYDVYFIIFHQLWLLSFSDQYQFVGNFCSTTVFICVS